VSTQPSHRVRSTHHYHTKQWRHIRAATPGLSVLSQATGFSAHVEDPGDGQFRGSAMGVVRQPAHAERSSGPGEAVARRLGRVSTQASRRIQGTHRYHTNSSDTFLPPCSPVPCINWFTGLTLRRSGPIPQITTSRQATRFPMSTFSPPLLPDPVVPPKTPCSRATRTRHVEASSNNPGSIG